MMALPQDSGDGATKERDWMGFITALLFRGTMRWEEIMRAPLLRLNAIHDALPGEYCKNVGISPKGDGEKVEIPSKETPPMNREAFFAMVNGG